MEYADLCKKYPVPTEAGGILEKISKCLKNHFPSISYYFHIPKFFLNFFPHTRKNRNKQKSNLLPYTANVYRQTTDKLMFKSVISTVR